MELCFVGCSNINVNAFIYVHLTKTLISRPLSGLFTLQSNLFCLCYFLVREWKSVCKKNNIMRKLQNRTREERETNLICGIFTQVSFIDIPCAYTWKITKSHESSTFVVQITGNLIPLPLY